MNVDIVQQEVCDEEVARVTVDVHPHTKTLDQHSQKVKKTPLLYPSKENFNAQRIHSRSCQNSRCKEERTFERMAPNRVGKCSL